MRFPASHTENCELGTRQLQGNISLTCEITYLDILNNGKGSQLCQIEFIVFIQMNAYKHYFVSIYPCRIVLIDIS